MLDAEKWEVLDRLVATDQPAEPTLSALLRAAEQAFTGLTAAISILDRDGGMFRSRFGEEAAHAVRAGSLCDHTTSAGSIQVIPDAALDTRFSAHPVVARRPGVRFYAGAPIAIDGMAIATLWLFDRHPRHAFDQREHRLLNDFAEALGGFLRLRLELADRDALARRASVKARKLLLAEALAGVGHWRLDVASGEVHWSDEVYRIHGADPATFDPALHDALQFYVGNDAAMVATHVERAVACGESFAFKALLRRASDGSVRKVMSKGEVELDASGRTVGVFGVFQDITEQEKLLEQVTEDRERYRLITQNATDVISVYNPTGSFTYVSPAAESILGYAPETLVGRPIYDFIHVEDRASVACQLEALASDTPTTTAPRIEYRALRTDGAVIWIEAHPRAIFDREGRLDGFQDVARDVTARKAAEDTARTEAAAAEQAREIAAESEGRYRLLAEHATDMIWRVSLSGTIDYVTPSAERILGYTPEEMIGRTTANFTHPDDLEFLSKQVEAHIEAGADAAPIATEFRAVRKDGRVIWLEGRPSVVFGPGGQPFEHHDVLRDVTERKRLQDALIAAREAAEAAVRTKSDFLANMSHELRTPLNSIVGFSGLISDAPELGVETRRRIDLVKTASRSLVTIVNDILEFSKLESEGVTLCPEPVDIEQLLRTACDLLRDEAIKKSLTLDVQIRRSGPLVLADPSRLQQVVLNLVGNAIKFTAHGGVSVTLSDDDRGFIKVSVKDTGVGIPPARISAIFERFAQADASTSRQFGGTGLGLAISRTIVDAMAGDLGVESVEGQGSTFWFSFNPPLADAASPPRRVIVPDTATHLDCRLLLADDNDANRDLFCAMMAGRGLEIYRAANGAEAVRAVQQQAFDVVLMDVQMPVMDGIEATRLIRALGFEDLPIIALTANVMLSQISLCRAAGMNDHLSKPYTTQEVMDVLGRWTTPDRRRAMQNEAMVVLENRLDGLERSLGSRALDGFLERLAEQLRAMSDLLAAPLVDARELGRRAHSVRGLAGTLGFTEVANSYAALEHACDTADDLPEFALPALQATTVSLAEIALRRAAA